MCVVSFDIRCGRNQKSTKKKLCSDCTRCGLSQTPKKQVIAIGKKTGCDVELHPEIIYNTPSILLFCRYANALRTLPDPLGRQHLKRSRRGQSSSSSSTICSIALLDVGSAGSACSRSFLSTGSPHCRRRWNTECTDYNTSITPGASAPPANRQDATVVSKIVRSSTAHPVFS